MVRRGFLACVGGAVLAACGSEQASPNAPLSPSSGGSPCDEGCGGRGGGATAGTGGRGGGPLVCTPSDDNIEGPYYRPDAPFRDDLTDSDTAGERIRVRGQVLSSSCTPLPGAVLDFWQANDAGRYDNDGVDDPPGGAFVLRGRVVADEEGRFDVRTILPGRYLNGSQYRPAHIHVKVSADGHAPLTTQLYFEGDPFNDVDPFIVDTLIMTLDDSPEPIARFDFVLAPA